MHEVRTRHRHEPEAVSCGFFLLPRPDGFVLHMSASPEHVSEMRALVFKAATSAGASEDVADSARLVAGELVANVVRLCGPWAPVVVLVAGTDEGVVVEVHDPVPSAVPGRKPEAPDNTHAETGRGLWILDALAPGWSVAPTPVGKRITCTLPHGEPASV
ncbi:ATP-binding protein [Kitasatospora sp. NPDC057198]|uniref:ATP-binding protein n=1 Tax=Kitasatospora sp. NPDC057198 TaxID=3346046 RepID=UPI003631DF8D